MQVFVRQYMGENLGVLQTVMPESADTFHQRLAAVKQGKAVQTCPDTGAGPLCQVNQSIIGLRPQ